MGTTSWDREHGLSLALQNAKETVFSPNSFNQQETARILDRAKKFAKFISASKDERSVKGEDDKEAAVEIPEDYRLGILSLPLSERERAAAEEAKLKLAGKFSMVPLEGFNEGWNAALDAVLEGITLPDTAEISIALGRSRVNGLRKELS